MSKPLQKTESDARAALPFSVERANVCAVDGARVEVTAPSLGTLTARLALPMYRAEIGDAVLLASGPDGSRYVVGVLRALREVEPLVAADGTTATLEHGEGGEETLRVRDARGRLVFEHREDQSVVHAPSGDLELHAPGRIRLASGERVEIHGAAGARVSSEGPVELRSSAASLELDGDRTHLETGRLVTAATLVEAKLEEARVVAGTLRTVVDRIRERAEIVERTASRIVTRAKEVYRETEGLEQTRAGQVRLVAEEALALVGQTTLVKAKEDVKIKGEKIYLA